MMLPQLFSKRGRQALVAYAFILVFTGPAKNTMRNMRILSESMACTQVCNLSIDKQQNSGISFDNQVCTCSHNYFVFLEHLIPMYYFFSC